MQILTSQQHYKKIQQLRGSSVLALLTEQQKMPLSWSYSLIGVD